MNIIRTVLDDVIIIEPKVFGDHRGWFTETYSKKSLTKMGIEIDFVQDNHSFSAQKGTLRGLHFQINPKAQTKLVRCTKGKILDVAVDIRVGSPTYKKWVAVELSEENKRQLLIPRGFAHGFLTLTDDVEVQYKVDEYYSPEHDRSIRYDDQEFAIDWGIEAPILSEKDLSAPLLGESDSNFSLKFMVTGINGQLGFDVFKCLSQLGADIISPTIDNFDLRNSEQVKRFILENNPDVIIHCAAYTAVDRAEDEKEQCRAVNVDGTKAIAESAKIVGAKLVYISTDYVFDGKGLDPHLEEDETNPVNYYGLTKQQGELLVKTLVERHFIIRTSWLYGINGNNFVKTMLNIAKTKAEINVVSDQIGSPTYTKDLAKFIVSLVQTEKYGIYHGVNDGFCSWYDFAKSIFDITKTNVVVKPILTVDYTTKAKRPLNSRLSQKNTDKARFERMPHWKDALNRFINELNC